MKKALLPFAFVAATTTPTSAPATPVGAGLQLPCARTTLDQLTMPTGPAQYQSGKLVLRNGASMRLQGSNAELYQAQQIKPCADAPPSRTITVLDIRNGSYYASLIGAWKTP